MDSCLVLIPINIFEFVDSRPLGSTLLDCFKDLREILIVLFDKLDALERVFPVGAHMVSTSCKLVVVIAVMLIRGGIVSVLNEADVLGYVEPLSKVLYVKAEINYHLLAVVGIAIADQE